MPYTVWLVGEGPSDIGGLAKDPVYRDDSEGYLQPIIRNILPNCDLEFDGGKLTQFPTKGITTPKSARARRARVAAELAAAEDACAVVVHFDTDKEQGVSASDAERVQRMSQIRSEIEGGFAGARASLANGVVPIQMVAAVPSRMTEAWALGDVDAIRSLGGALQHVPGQPERCWGAVHDPTSNYPKAVWERASRGGISFADIAAASDPEKVAAACPESFAPFLADVRNAALAICPEVSVSRPD